MKFDSVFLLTICSLPLLIVFHAMPAFAQAGQCPAVNCDCEHVANHVWRAECREYQAALRKSCIANGGKPTGYCRLHGPKGMPVALSTPYSPVELVDKESIAKLKKAIDMKTWSAKGDLDAVHAASQHKDYAAVYYALKHYDEVQEEVHELRRQLGESLVALGDADQAAALWKQVQDSLAADAEEKGDFAREQKKKAEAEWARAQAADTGDKDKRLLRALALRRVKNAGNYLERSAEVHANRGDAARAAEDMQLAAGLAELLLKWKVETSGKPAIVRYYRYQTAARWHSAANYWMVSDTSSKAQLALREAQRLLTGADASAIADL